MCPGAPSVGDYQRLFQRTSRFSSVDRHQDFP
jgi:hypothetical protein